jgi:hypothetical protein
LGVGILATAMKRGLLEAGHRHTARDWMVRLNRAGSLLGGMETVHALTDITGFGLLGHVLEMCQGSGTRAVLRYADIPVIPESLHYLQQGCYADGALRNWKKLFAPHRRGQRPGADDATERSADKRRPAGGLCTWKFDGIEEKRSPMRALLAMDIGCMIEAADGPLVRVE